jgi:hypothetical protein
MTKAGPIKGYKCTDADLKCKDFQFKVGETYEHSGPIVMCQSGFHFHENGGDIFKYYANSVRSTRVVEVLAHGVITGDDKSVCQRIEVVRELSLFEVCALVGSGDGDGDGDGDGYGYGYGYGDGSGYGSGDGDGYGYGYGSGSGDGDGDGYGYGSGDGDGDGYGYGYGDGEYKLPDGIFFEEAA